MLDPKTYHHLQNSVKQIEPFKRHPARVRRAEKAFMSGASLCVLRNEITTHARGPTYLSKWSNRLVCRSRRRRCNYYRLLHTHARIKQRFGKCLGRIPKSALSFAQREHIIYVNDPGCCNALALNKQEISLNKRTIEAALSEFMIFVKSISSPNCN